VSRAAPLAGLDDPALVDFWRERHLCTLTTLREDGTPHVVPVGCVLDPVAGEAWVISTAGSRKVRNLVAAGDDGQPVAVCQVDGRRWSTLEGRATVHADRGTVHEAERRYAERYREPRENPERVAIRIALTRVLSSRLY
jgi:PPOX class probable F420-dependent enzyme